jgi:hypothetical protein
MRRIVNLALAVALVAIPAAASARKPNESHNVVVADAAAAKGEFELVGHEPLMNRGMNAALAVHKGYAYVGSRTDGLHPNAGVMIVDVSDPGAPTVVGQIGMPDAANPGETTREMRIWPEEDILIVLNLASNCSYLIHACSPTSAAGSDIYRFFDISGDKAAAPELIAEYEPSSNPHEFFLWDDPKDTDRTLLYQSNTGSGTQMTITDISNARKGKFDEIVVWETVVPSPDTDNRLHSMTVTPNGKRTHIAILGGGYLELDTTQVAQGKAKPKIKLITNMQKRPAWGDPGAHSTVKFPGRDFVFAGDEVYGEIPVLLAGHGCPWGWVRIIDIRNHVFPKIVSEFKLPQNEEEFCESLTDNDPLRNSTSSYAAHNPTLTENLALMSWHAGGIVAIDISDPKKPALAAQFIPEPLPAVTQEDPALSSGHDKVAVWSFPIVKDGLIYVVDIRNGLYILKYSGPYENEVAGLKFLEGNSNLGDAARLEGS